MKRAVLLLAMLGLVYAASASVTNKVSTVEALTAALADTTCDVIELADGEYALTSQLKLERAVTLRGNGYGRCTLRQTATNQRVVYMTHADARLEGVTVTGGNFSGNPDWKQFTGLGCGIFMQNGTVDRCCITRNIKVSGQGRGCGVFISGGTLSRSLIVTNGILEVTGCHSPFGGGICVGDNDYVSFAPVFIDSCLVADNILGGTWMGKGAGIHVGSKYNRKVTTIRNTTITGNQCYTGAAGIYTEANDKIVLQNCIIAGNKYTGTETGAPNWYAPDPTTWAANISHCLWGVEGQCQRLGVGSVLEPPYFTDAAKGDYTLGLGSKAIGLGEYYEGISTDVLGVTRRNPPDAGCYQSSHPYPVSCDVKFGPMMAFVGSTISLTGEVANATAGVNYDYYWTLTDREGSQRHLTGQRLDVSDFAPADYEILLAVSNRAVEADNAYLYATNRLVVVPLTNYVTSATGATPIRPYATPGKAATSLNVAFAVTLPGSVIVLDEGTHKISATLSLSKKILIVGAGREKTIVKPNATGFRHFTLNHPEAKVQSMTLSGAYVGEAGSCVWIGANGGSVTDCAIVGNTLNSSNRWKGPLYCESADGIVDRCHISCNTNQSITYGWGNTGDIVYMSKGVLRNSIIKDNVLRYISGAWGGHIVRLLGTATMENCTVVGNRDYGTTPAAVYMESKNAKLVNVIMTDNQTSATNGCLPNLSRSNGAVNNCCFVGSTAYGANSFVAKEAGFVDGTAGDYHLRNNSPCRNEGLYQSWMSGAQDFYGRARVMGKAVDIGATECPPIPFMLKIR